MHIVLQETTTLKLYQSKTENIAHMQCPFWLNLGLLQPAGRSVVLKAWLGHIA